MRLLHVTDLHFNKVHCEWILGQQYSVDVICISGDFLDDSLNQEVSIDEQIIWFQSWFSRFNCIVIVCSGNHDEINRPNHWLNNLPVTCRDGQIKEIGGIVFGCIPYGDDDYEKYRDCNVLLHHEPPSGISVAIQNGSDFGSDSLRYAIQQGTLSPEWLLSGHVHNPKKNAVRLKGIKISNPGSNPLFQIPNHHFMEI